MRIRMAASAAVIAAVAATGMTAGPAQARTLHVRVLPPRYRVVEGNCIDFTPMVTSHDAGVIDIQVMSGSVGFPTYYCPRGRVARMMRNGWVRFKVHYVLSDFRNGGHVSGRYKSTISIY